MPRPNTARRAARKAPHATGPLAWGVCLLLVVAGVVLRFSLPLSPRDTPDELLYTVYAGSIAREGPGVQARLVREYNTAELADVPPPTRIGFTWPAAVMVRLTGTTGAPLGGLTALSMWCSALTLVLLCGVALRTFDPWTAAFAVAFLAASPLDLALARRGWVDAPLELVATAMLVVFVRCVREPRSRWWPLALFTLGMWAALVKETGVLLVALAAAGLAVARLRAGGGWRGTALALAGGVAALLLAAGILTLVSGGLDPWRTALERVARAAAANDYVRRYQTGSPIYYAVGLGVLQPLPWLLGLAAAIAVALRAPFLARVWPRPDAPVLLQSAAWLVLLFGAVACAYPQKNMRFLSPIYPAIALLAAGAVRAGIAALTARLPGRTARIAVAAIVLVVVAGAVLDLRRFTQFFLRMDILDLATPWFTGGG